jgi:hypothetical protein
VALDTKDWQELYEGAREVFGPARAAIFMKAMKPGLRQDLATKADVSDLRASFEEKLRTQTWAIVGAFVGIGGLTVTLAHLT